MICLGIETSCDETALALWRQGRIVDAVLASQADLHAIFGGVVPEMASREHLRFIGPLFDELLARNDLAPQAIDLIAVTRGPGLLGSLLVGAAFAKALALALNIPIIGVNHLHAHLLACGLKNEIPFPCLGLVVSGGHTELYRMQSPREMIRLGRTLDDAAGEVFDKFGQAVGLPYPAGRMLDELGREASHADQPLPRPYLDNDNLDFSFSGLKTAAIARARALGLLCGANRAALAPLARSLNEAAAHALCAKVERALARNADLRGLCLAGGVAANSFIRQTLQDAMRARRLPFLAPDIPLCADNAAMIAHAGALLAQAGLRHGLEFEAIPRGRPIPDDAVCQRGFA